jgi:hypothetical protein
MEIETRIDQCDNAYSVQIGLANCPEDALTPVERQAFQAFGEPVVDVGGSFSGEDLSFTLPSDQRRFPSQFPVKQVFSLADNSDANARAVLYQTTIQARLVAARNTQTEKSDGTVGRFVTTL